MDHEVLIYSGGRQFRDGVASFARDGVASGFDVVVAVPRPKIAPLSLALGSVAADVVFLDMHELGRNPGRLTSAWHRLALAAAASGRRLWGVGEPVWAGRTTHEMIECHRHEVLLGDVLRGTPTTLLCPYDVSVLPASTIEIARQTHPLVRTGPGLVEPNPDHRPDATWSLVDRALAERGEHAGQIVIDATTMRSARNVAADVAASVGIDAARLDDVMLVVGELVANTVRHSGGQGSMRWWIEEDEPARRLVFEVRDGGRISDRLVGRQHPSPEQIGGRGLWLVHHLSDLVQERSSHSGTVVRVSFAAT